MNWKESDSEKKKKKKKRFVPDFIIAKYKEGTVTLFDRLKNTTKTDTEERKTSKSVAVEDTYFFTDTEMCAYVHQDTDTHNPLFY